MHMPGTFVEHAAEECGQGIDCVDAPRIHWLADVEPGAVVGERTQVWRWTLIRSGAFIGRGCKVGSGVVIGPDVLLGDGCKVEDGAKVYGPARIAEHVFLGPNCVLCNDRYPSALVYDWKPSGEPTRIERGASIGAGAVVLIGVRIGPGALIGAGAVVTRDVPAGATATGCPARVVCVAEV